MKLTFTGEGSCAPPLPPRSGSSRKGKFLRQAVTLLPCYPTTGFPWLRVAGLFLPARANSIRLIGGSTLAQTKVVQKSICAVVIVGRLSPLKMRLRAFVTSGLVVAFLTALTLAASPQLHEKLHKVGSQHECAATMIASGNCDHNAPPSVAPKIQDALVSPAFLGQHFRFVIASVPSSVQEHAPPVAP
jgi:hypothetical protein